LIDCARRRAFDAAHDLNERKNLLLVVVDQWRENDVDVIRHNHRDVEFVFLTVIVATTGEHDVSSVLR
jgi:hypothetical protein